MNDIAITAVPTTRVLGWQRLLNEYLLQIQEEYTEQGFIWGKTDCIHFVGRWAEILTGADILSPYTGRYSTKDEAFEFLGHTFGGLQDALAAHFGDPIHPSHGHRGDIAYNEATQACGLIFNKGSMSVALFLGEQGFHMLYPRMYTCAFKVGRL